MATHRITYEQLIAYAAGTLPADQADRVAAHLQADRDAASTVARFRLAQRAVATDDSVAPPASALSRAKSIFQPRAETSGSWLDAIDRLVAKIIFDSRVQPMAVRSATQVADRVNLTFATDDAEVDLQAECVFTTEAGPPGAKRWQVMGQISGLTAEVQATAAALTFPGTNQPVVEASVDPHGAFSFDVSSGEFDLLIRTEAGVVLLPAIKFGELA